MIKRNKIIILIAIVLISSLAFVLMLREGPVTVSKKETIDADLPPNHSHTKKNSKGDESVFDGDSLYEHLSNRPAKVDDKLLHDKDSIALLSD